MKTRHTGIVVADDENEPEVVSNRHDGHPKPNQMLTGTHDAILVVFESFPLG